MAWAAVFPTNTQLISQSVGQFQANWAFLQTNINTDHYFNSGAPNEGHHRFSQYVNQAGDPALAVDGCIYVKPTPSAATIQPFYKNASASAVQQIPTVRSGVVAVGGTGLPTNFLNLAGTPAFSGFITCVDQTSTATRGCAFVCWSGAVCSVSQIAVAGAITALGASGTNITITSAAPHNDQYNLITFYN